MFRACLAFAFVLSLAMSGFAQTNSEEATRVPGMSQPLPVNPKAVKDSALAADSLKAAKAKRKSKAKAKSAAEDSAKAAKAARDSVAAAPAPVDSVKTVVPMAPPDSAKAATPESPDTAGVPAPAVVEAKPEEIKREPQDTRLFNDPQLI
ncbi:MAG TPA: hypothetical protein VJ385_11565, partial [Fibrobacteria bacterium]|nr:hypothetical protein [Fibrobacteria bacterium]